MYLELLELGKEWADVKILAYCLMPNHVHHVIIPGRVDSLSRLFRRVHGEYARRINRREGWQGHLWQERFHSSVLEEDHLLATVRYVELNPVRAGLCGRPDGWRWSSVHAHLTGEKDSLVDGGWMDKWISDWPAFLCMQESETDLAKIRRHTATGLPIGDDTFVAELERRTGRCLRVRRRGPKPAEP